MVETHNKLQKEHKWALKCLSFIPCSIKFCSCAQHCTLYSNSFQFPQHCSGRRETCTLREPSKIFLPFPHLDTIRFFLFHLSALLLREQKSNSHGLFLDRILYSARANINFDSVYLEFITVKQKKRSNNNNNNNSKKERLN